MSNKLLTSLTGLNTPAGGDLIYLVDVSDTTDSANGTNKKATISNLFAQVQSINTNLVTKTDTQTLTNKTLTSPTLNTPTITSPDLSADSIDAITEIASALKTGSDTKLVTGTAGTSGYVAQWNVDGDLVDGKIIPAGAIVGTTDTQTLSGKTLTTPRIDTITEDTSANGVTVDGLNIKDSTLNTANAVTALSAISGGVIQVVTAQTSTTTSSIGVETFILEASITPKRSDSKLIAIVAVGALDNLGAGRATCRIRHDTSSGGVTGTQLSITDSAQDSTGTSGQSNPVLIGVVSPGNTTLRYFKLTVQKQDSSTATINIYGETTSILVVEVRA